MSKVSSKCKKCGERYKNQYYAYGEFCIPCQRNYLKNNFSNWTSNNEKIDDFIQRMQLKIDSKFDIILEWIPYNQFYNIKEIITDDFSTMYSTIWKDGPLDYDDDYEKKWIRLSDEKVSLKCLHNSQNIDELLNEV